MIGLLVPATCQHACLLIIAHAVFDPGESQGFFCWLGRVFKRRLLLPSQLKHCTAAPCTRNLSGCCCAGLNNWYWLDGDFNVGEVIQVVRDEMSATWDSWIDGRTPIKQAAFAQLVAAVMVRQRVTRAGQVDKTPFSWQDLENIGMAYLSQPSALC